MTLSELQVQRDNLFSTLNGVRSVTVEGRSILYEGPSEVREALRELDAQIARLNAPNQQRIFTIQSNRGIS